MLKTRVRATGGGIKKLAAVTVGAVLASVISLSANAAIKYENNSLQWTGDNTNTPFELSHNLDLTVIQPDTSRGLGTSSDLRDILAIDLNSYSLTTKGLNLSNHYYPVDLIVKGGDSFKAENLMFAGQNGSENSHNPSIPQTLTFEDVKSVYLGQLTTWSEKEGTSAQLSLKKSNATIGGFSMGNSKNAANLVFQLAESSLTFKNTNISDNSKLQTSYYLTGENNQLVFDNCGVITTNSITLRSDPDVDNDDVGLYLKLTGNSVLNIGEGGVAASALNSNSIFVLDASEATNKTVFQSNTSFRVHGTTQSTFIGKTDQIFNLGTNQDPSNIVQSNILLREGVHSFTIMKGTLNMYRLNAFGSTSIVGHLYALDGGKLNLTGTIDQNVNFNGQIKSSGDGSLVFLKDFSGINFADKPVELIVQDGGSISLVNTTKIGDNDNRALLGLKGNEKSALTFYGNGNTAHSSDNFFKLSDSISTHAIGDISLKGADINIDANQKNLVVLGTIGQGISNYASNFSINNFNIFSVNVFNVAGEIAKDPSKAGSELIISNGAETFINSLNFNGPDTAVAFEDVDRIQLNFVKADGHDLEINSGDESELHLGEVTGDLNLKFGENSAKKLSVYATDTDLASLISEGNLDVSGASGLQSLDIRNLNLEKGASFTDLTSLNVTGWTIASGSTVNLNLGNELSGGEAIFATNLNSNGQTSDNLTWNLSSKASDLSVAEGFSTIKFGDNNAGADSTIALGQGGWLAVGNQPGLEETTTALKAFAQNGNAKTSILSFSNGADPLQVGTIKSDGPLMVLAKSDELNNPTALVNGSTADKPTLLLGSDVGFYLVSNFVGIEADAKVLVTNNYGDWRDYNGKEVGADNIFTKWEVVTDEQGNLSYQLKEVKTVTETLPNIIPSNGFGEILGNKNAQGGFDKGTGIGLISPEPAKIPSVGSILVGSIMDYGASDTGLISDLANTFASFATSGGVQAGAMGMSSMVSQSLDRHYSYTTTVGVNPLDTHVAGAGDLWVDALYRHDQTRGLSNGAGEYGNKTNLRGIVLGQDITLDNAWTVGAVVNYIDGQTDSDKSTIDITNKSKSYGVSAWAGYVCPGNFSLKTTASYARGDNDLTANMPWEMSESFKNIYSTAWNELTDADKAGLPETIDTGIKASMDTETVTLSARVEHLIQTPYVDIIPHIAVQYDRVKSDSYTMKIGGVGAIDTKVETMNTFSVPVGVAFAKSQTDAKTGWNSRVMADVYATPRFGDTEATVRSNFHGYNAVDKGKVEVMDDVSYGASVGAQVFKKNFAVGFNAGLEGSGKGTSASANVNAVWRF